MKAAHISWILAVVGLAGCGGSRGGVAAAPPAPTATSGAAEAPGEANEGGIEIAPATDAVSRAQGPLFEVAGSCARVRPGAGPRRVGPVRASASVALVAQQGKQGRRLLAYVADGDDPLLHTVDVTAGREVAVTPLRGAPEHVLVLADGRVAVTLRQASEVQILEPQSSPEAPLETRCAVAVPTEPIALAETPDASTLVLTSGWAHALTALDAITLAGKFQVDLPREPRAVIVADDGKRAFVAHLVNATMSVVDLGDGEHRPRALDLKLKQATPGVGHGKERGGCQGYALASSVELPRDPGAPSAGPSELPPIAGAPKPAPPAPPAPPPGPKVKPAGRLFAPFVSVDPGEPTRATAGYGNAQAALPAEVSAVTVIDMAAERLFTRAVMGTSTQPATRDQADCLLPRSAAYFEKSLYVTCLGNNALLELDARAVDPARAELRRWATPDGPVGVAIDPVSGQAVVHGQFAHKLAVVALQQQGGPPATIALSQPKQRALSAQAERGRVLFHAAHNEAISSDGRACASCHPDGREDALTWSTPDGPRQTLMLAGRLADSAPYSWSGNNATVEEHVKHTFQRLEGKGLDEAEMKALLAYIGGMKAPRPGRATLAEAARASLVERGQALYQGAETACASCHPAGGSDGRQHSVGTKTAADRTDRFETPSLRFLGRTAPYFHDGRYRSLEQMLEASDHHMGQTLHLSRDERQALLAYLETL